MTQPDLITKAVDYTPKWLRGIGGRVFVLAILIIIGVLVYGGLGGVLGTFEKDLIESVYWGVVVATTGKKASGTLADGLRAMRSLRPGDTPHIDHNAG